MEYFKDNLRAGLTLGVLTLVMMFVPFMGFWLSLGTGWLGFSRNKKALSEGKKLALLGFVLCGIPYLIVLGNIIIMVGLLLYAGTH